MKIDFTQYNNEKLKHWIYLAEKLPITRLIYDEDYLKLYSQAHQELINRGLTL